MGLEEKGRGREGVRRGWLFPVCLHGGFFQNQKRSSEEGLAGRRQGEKVEAGSRPVHEAEELVSAPTPTQHPRALLTEEVRGASNSQTCILPLTFRVLSSFVFLLFLLRVDFFFKDRPNNYKEF